MSAIATPPHAVDVEHEPSFAKRYETALANPRLARNVTRYQQNWRVSRNASMVDVSFEELRDSLTAAKNQVLENLEQYIAEFEANATANGAVVHHARTAEDAKRIVKEIAQARGIDLIVKSKSMVTEEIELNHYLDDFDIEAVETDLGEWIIQKAGQRPSHIVGPALHMGREDVGELLNGKLGLTVSREDIPEQVHAIRDLIRPKFFEAGMGMTGANALIAETGTVMMATNEGNGRLSSSAPPCHVVMAGIEKLIPTFEDAVTQMRLLARSGTGQRMTVYTTFISGPTPGHEMHIILVDNGRRAMRDRPEFIDALRCIRCGACANVCPPYSEVGGHVFGHIYTGAIGLVVTPFLNSLDDIAKPQSLCLSCNACETVCPVGIPLPRQILDVRKMVAEKNGLPPAKRVVLDVYARRSTFALATRIGARMQKPLQNGSFVRGNHVPVLKQQTRWRSMPALPSQPLRDRVKRFKGTASALKPLIPNLAVGTTVALFPGCMTDRVFPEQGESIVTTLRALGVNVIFPDGLHCCGLVANNSGDEEHAVMMAKQTIRVLERVPADLIVSGSASCVATLAQDYLHLFRNDPEWLAKAEKLSPRVVDFTTFLDKVAQIPDGSLLPKNGKAGTVTYHDSCQGSNALGLKEEPRRILNDVLGVEVSELPENTLCCGFGGSFSFEYPEIAERLMNRKLNNAESTGARTIVTDNQGCIMHLRGGCDAAGRPLEVKHIAELLAERIRQIDPAL
jgi:iron-sulfur cluster protein